MAQDLQLAAHKSRKLEKTVSSKYLVTARLQLGMQNRLETAIVAKCYLTTVDTLHAVVCSTSCWLAGLGLRPNFPLQPQGAADHFTRTVLHKLLCSESSRTSWIWAWLPPLFPAIKKGLLDKANNDHTNADGSVLDRRRKKVKTDHPPSLCGCNFLTRFCTNLRNTEEIARRNPCLILQGWSCLLKRLRKSAKVC